MTASAALERVHGALEEYECAPRRNGNQLTALCPAHEDRHPSLSVTTGHDGRALVHCHTGCATCEVLEALGLEWPDLFDGDAPKPWTRDGLRRTGARLDRDGRVRMGGVRYLPGAPEGTPKVLADKESARGLFPDPESVPGDTLYVVEGEADAVTAHSIGLPAVAVPGARRAWPKDWIQRIAAGRRRLVLLCDNDGPGKASMTAAARRLAEVRELADVRVLDLARVAPRDGTGKGFDLSDWVARLDAPDPAAVVRMLAVEHSIPVGIDPGELQRPAKLHRLDLARMLQDPPPPIPWAVEPLLIPGEITMLAGREGRGKSLLAIALATSVAAGRSPLDWAVRRGTAMVIDAENGEGETWRRVHGTDLPDPARLAIYNPSGLDLRQSADVLELQRELTTVAPDVLVLDSFASLAPGVKENDADRVGPLLFEVQRLARATDTAILLLHHTGKGDDAEYRGSTAIGAVVTIGLSLHAENDDPDPQRRCLRWWKCRPVERPSPVWFRMAPSEHGILLGQAEAYVPPKDTEAATRRSDVAQDILRDLNVNGPADSQVQLADRIGTERDHKTFRGAVRGLRDDGRILINGTRIELPQSAPDGVGTGHRVALGDPGARAHPQTGGGHGARAPAHDANPPTSDPLPAAAVATVSNPTGDFGTQVRTPQLTPDRSGTRGRP